MDTAETRIEDQGANGSNRRTKLKPGAESGSYYNIRLLCLGCEVRGCLRTSILATQGACQGARAEPAATGTIRDQLATPHRMFQLPPMYYAPLRHPSEPYGCATSPPRHPTTPTPITILPLRLRTISHTCQHDPLIPSPKHNLNGLTACFNHTQGCRPPPAALQTRQQTPPMSCTRGNA